MKTIKTGMTKYEQDKEVVKQLPPLTSQEYKEVEEDLTNYIEENKEVIHYAIISQEKRYYTIFKRESMLLTHEGMAEKILEFIRDNPFFADLGKLTVLKRAGDNRIDIWVGSEFFMLFPADDFFVNF